MSTIGAGKTVGELVAERPSRARVFEQLGIDYCCGGKQTLSAACEEKGLDGQTVVQVLKAVEAEQQTRIADSTDWTQASLAALCNHIEETHHRYLRADLPRIASLMDKVVGAHGERHPSLHQLRETFAALSDELQRHLRKEEQVLFPAIRQLEGATDREVGFPFGSVANPIRAMEAEHDSAGQALAMMRQLTNDYTPPADACNSYRAMLDALQQLERDLHQHIHKENNILFPRAIDLEQRRYSPATSE